ncbi:Uncharacterized protein DBV15_04860 [Temnothorax longispinosus]|uniref:Uncharacterized protein n=1 Tax=Temnothorax longispinosus TaxID=300112 RepID=A0A4S2JB57_9HYME|nr:Uncharacterized protein DBV15_04860 [Temnothorax longispinosus]
MSSLILSHDSHLMMLEVAVENLFVPWTTALDKVILKKTIVTFRMLDKDWISLSPNRRDYRPYQGSNYENEKFYGGRSIVFSVPTDFFEKEASGVDVQLYVRKQVCKYFEMVSRQRIGFAAVPVDNLLNSIAKQIRERNELAEHLSDFYKRQIISRSMMGTYTLLDENFRNTAATISLYIRISYLGKCLVTEITQVKSIRGAFYTRGDSDEKQPYFSRQLTSKELQSGCWVDGGLPHVPHGRLICRCEELVKKEAADLAMTREAVVATIAMTTAVADVTPTIPMRPTTVDAVADTDLQISVTEVAVDTAVIKRKKALANKVADSAAISVPKIVADADATKKRKTPTDTVADSAVISVPKVVPDAVAIKGEKALADAVADSTVISVPKVVKVVADAAAIKTEKAPADVAESAANTVAKIDTVNTDAAAIKRRKIFAIANATVDSTAIPIAAGTVEIKRRKAPANAVANSAAIPVGKVAEDVAVAKENELDSEAVDFTAISVAKIAAIIDTRNAPADYGALGDRTDASADVDALANAHEITTIPIMATDNEVINDERASIRRKDLIDSLIKDVKADVAATAKTKGYAIKDNGERAFKKTFSTSSKSKRGRNTATIGITERGRRILPPPSPPFPRLQTYPLCCQLQPHLTCFTDCFDVSPCYCYWTACPLQFFYSA